MPTDYVFTHALYVFTTDRWDLFSVAQSTLHEVWARKYSGSLKQDLRYSPSKCFNTFAFPAGLWQGNLVPLPGSRCSHKGRATTGATALYQGTCHVASPTGSGHSLGPDRFPGVDMGGH